MNALAVKMKDNMVSTYLNLSVYKMKSEKVLYDLPNLSQKPKISTFIETVPIARCSCLGKLGREIGRKFSENTNFHL